MSKKVGNATIYLNVWKRDDDEHQTQPDFRGKLDVAGESFECSLWINKTLQGYPIHLSGQITRREDDE